MLGGSLEYWLLLENKCIMAPNCVYGTLFWQAIDFKHSREKKNSSSLRANFFAWILSTTLILHFFLSYMNTHYDILCKFSYYIFGLKMSFCRKTKLFFRISGRVQCRIWKSDFRILTFILIKKNEKKFYYF